MKGHSHNETNSTETLSGRFVHSPIVSRTVGQDQKLSSAPIVNWTSGQYKTFTFYLSLHCELTLSHSDRIIAARTRCPPALSKRWWAGKALRPYHYPLLRKVFLRSWQ